MTSQPPTDTPPATLGVDTDEMIKNAKQASSFLKSLANENRLMILCSLSQGERNVSALETLLDVRQPTLSQQLARLRSDNLVKTRRDAKEIYYSLASDEACKVVNLVYELFCSKTLVKGNS